MIPLFRWTIMVPSIITRKAPDSSKSLGHIVVSLFPLPENLVHVDGALLQHLIPDVGVDVGGSLVVGVAHDLHGNQRVYAAFVEQGDVVVPEIMRRDDGLDSKLIN